MFNLHLKKNLEAWLGEEVPLISRQDTHLVSVDGVTILQLTALKTPAMMVAFHSFNSMTNPMN